MLHLEQNVVFYFINLTPTGQGLYTGFSVSTSGEVLISRMLCRPTYYLLEWDTSSRVPSQPSLGPWPRSPGPCFDGRNFSVRILNNYFYPMALDLFAFILP